MGGFFVPVTDITMMQITRLPAQLIKMSFGLESFWRTNEYLELIHAPGLKME